MLIHALGMKYIIYVVTLVYVIIRWGETVVFHSDPRSFSIQWGKCCVA